MKRFGFIFLCAIIGAASAYYAQPFVDKNSDVILIIITVFTVFAGFLIAIITIIGDPSLIPSGSWRVAEGRRNQMYQRLSWHVVLFTLYLLTIALLFAAVILEKALCEHQFWRLWVERAYLFVGITSFLFTFALPTSLMQMQQARYDAEIERRRGEVGIRSDGED